jgi:hypothetical protein
MLDFTLQRLAIIRIYKKGNSEGGRLEIFICLVSVSLLASNKSAWACEALLQMLRLG